LYRFAAPAFRVLRRQRLQINQMLQTIKTTLGSFAPFVAAR